MSLVKSNKSWNALPSRGGEDNYERYMSHDWEREFVKTHGPPVRRCKVCGYLNDDYGARRIPSCQEYSMNEALT